MSCSNFRAALPRHKLVDLATENMALSLASASLSFNAAAPMVQVSRRVLSTAGRCIWSMFRHCAPLIATNGSPVEAVAVERCSTDNSAAESWPLSDLTLAAEVETWLTASSVAAWAARAGGRQTGAASDSLCAAAFSAF